MKGSYIIIHITPGYIHRHEMRHIYIFAIYIYIYIYTYIISHNTDKFVCCAKYCCGNKMSSWRIYVINLPNYSEFGVTKAPIVNFILSKMFDLAKVPIRFLESHSYLTCVTAAELRWHLSNINVILNSWRVFWHCRKILKIVLISLIPGSLYIPVPVKQSWV